MYANSQGDIVDKSSLMQHANAQIALISYRDEENE
jgi:hypothetical protein